MRANYRKLKGNLWSVLMSEDLLAHKEAIQKLEIESLNM